MYKNKIFNALGAVAFCAVLGSCQKVQDFGDTNVDPNVSTTVNTGALLTNVLANFGGITNAGITTTLVPGLYSQYYAESTYPGTSLYADPNFSSAATYSGNLNDLQKIINTNSDPATAGVAAANGDNGNQIQVAKIMKAFHFSYLTDRYGDIPYSQALQGVNNLQPKYDDQESIYKSMISDLTTAATTLNAGGFALKGDIAYSGNIAKWKKLANSLRILFALRLSGRYPGASEYSAVELSKAYNDAGGYISTNADNFLVTYPGGNIKNPYFSLGQTLDNAVSSTFTSVLNGLTDTRVNVLSNSPTGVAYGLSSAAPANSARIFIPSYRLETSPLYFVTASHVLLAVAEAMERGWIAGKTTADAKIAYDAGVTASFAQWGLTIPAGYLSGAADYNSGSGVASIGSPVTVPGSSAATTTKLQRIWLQQYIAFYPDGSQSWANFRRTDFPVLKPTVNATNSSKKIPVRYTYAPDEYSYNSAQLNIQIAKMGGNSQDTRVWWDVN